MTKIKIIFFILFLVHMVVDAEEMTIVDIKRNIPLSDNDTVYKDYAINAGSSSGLKKNLVVFAKRKISIKDNSSKPIGDIETNVGQLKIIHVEGKVAIAREYKLISRDEEAMLEQIGIMTGDRIDLAGSFIDTKPLDYKKKVREPSSVASTEVKSAAPADTAPTDAPEKAIVPPILQIKPAPVPLPEI